MAARNKLTWDYKTREKIKSTALIKRLMKHINTHPDKKTYKKDLMTSTQVNAARILLGKSLPDLINVEGNFEHEHTGEVEHKHEHAVKNELADNFNDWKEKLSGSDKVQH